MIDHVKRGHADALLEFNKDGKLAILNGRVNPKMTISHVCHRKGNQLLLITCPQDCLQYFELFTVDLVPDLMENYDAQCFFGPNCKLPDHSMLTAVVNCMIVDENGDGNEFNVNNTRHRQRRHKYHGRHDEYLNSEMWHAAVQRIISNLHENEMMQNILDAVQMTFAKVFLTNWKKNYSILTVIINLRGSLSVVNPIGMKIWTIYGKNVRERKTIFVRYKAGCRTTKTQLHDIYKLAQRTFDKELRKCARCYNGTVVANIANLALFNHKEFWASLKRLCPRPDASIPLKVMTKDGYKTDRADVLYEWKNALQYLYNQTVLDGEFDDEFLQEKTIENDLEEQMEDEGYISNIELN